MTRIHDATGLAISYGDPVWKRGRRDILGTLTKQLNEYDHRISAFLGPATCNIKFMADPEEQNVWAKEGLGRTIYTTDHYQVGIWEGFVNEIFLTRGSIQMKIGPLIEIGNRVRAVYEEIDTSSDPPVSLGRTETFIAEDARSQARYGILEQIISVGQVETTVANQLRDIHLKLRKNAKTSIAINLDATDEPTIQLACLGLGDLLDAYIYEDLVGTGTQTLSDRVSDILSADPNGLFLLERIQENLYAIQEWEADYPTGLSTLREIVPLGDATDQRWIMYVKPGREFVYRKIENQVDYLYSAIENKMSNRAGNEVFPWSVEAGRWMRITDFLTGASYPDDLHEDIRACFIESVNFTAPNQISFEGGYVTNLNQYLAKLGLGGSYI